jgi:hypothetical protein
LSSLGLLIPALSPAGRITPGNVIVSYPWSAADHVTEYSPTGDLVQTITLPETVSESRAAVTDRSRLLHVWNRPFESVLNTYDPGTDSWSAHTYPGWSAFNCVPCNGIDAIGPYVFVNNQVQDRGILRFDTGGGPTIRFGLFHNYSDLTVGQNGRLYARYADLVDPPPPTVLDVYDPITGAPLSSITLAARALTIAVDENGSIYGGGGFSVNRYDSTGSVTATYPVTSYEEGAVYDLDRSSDGRFVLTTGNGWVILTDGAFQRTSAFRASAGSATIIEGNRPPVAGAGGPYAATADLPMTFDGSASIDPDADSLSYSWDFGDGTTGTGQAPSHTYADADSYMVMLTVSDGTVTASDSTYVRSTYRPTLSVNIAPNPIRASSRLTFHTAQPGPVKVDLYDVMGRRVRTLTEERQSSPGLHTIVLDGRGATGKPLPSGFYYYSIQASGQSTQGRFLLLR